MRAEGSRGGLLVLGVCLLVGFGLPRVLGSTEAKAEHLAHARAVLRTVPLIDGHNDLPWQYREVAANQLDKVDLRGDTTQQAPPWHSDIPRFRAGQLGGQFWSVYIPVSLGGPGATRATLEQIDVVYRMVEKYPDTFELALSASDVRAAFGRGRIASLIGMEGGHSIENSLAALRQLYRAGARYMTITHSTNTDWADSATDAPAHGGLTPFGVEVVREMNRLGMLVDLSHVSAETMHDALDVAEAPVIFSHSSCRTVTGHARNVPDDVLRRLPANGGVLMVTFVEPFTSDEVRAHRSARDAEEARLKSLWPGDPKEVTAGMETWATAHPAPRATLAQVADHIDHARQVAGIDHIGLGGDFDGMPRGPVGLEDVSKYPQLFAELITRGYSDDDLRKIAGENVLRALAAAEATARRLQGERPASDRRLEDLDRPAAAKGATKP